MSRTGLAILVVVCTALGFLLGATFLAIFILSISISEEFRNFGLGVTGIVGIGLLAWRSWSASRTSQATVQAAQAASDSAKAAIEQGRESHQATLMDRFTKAVEQLGNESPTARVGAIFVLENIAKGWTEYHWNVIETLAWFIRNEIPVPSLPNQRQRLIDRNFSSSIKDAQARRPDIATALKVIGRRNVDLETEDQFVDLNMTNLHAALLDGANLTRVILFRCILSKASLQKTTLKGANLGHAFLFQAKFQGADLRGVANVQNANFQEANFFDANVDGVDFSQAAKILPAQEYGILSKKGTVYPRSKK